MDIWQETFPVRFAPVDRSDRITLAAAFDFFQEAAVSHAEDLGVGRAAMSGGGQVWVLSRMSVLMERRPRQYETITVRSWPRGWERLFAIRDYDIRDSADIPVVRGRSAWIILDMEKRRPLRPQGMADRLPLNEGLDALPGGVQGLESRSDLRRAGEREAAYSDIDYNGHVNNARYIQWIQDVTESDLLTEAERIRLDINYVSEVKYGERTEILQAEFEDPGASRALAYEGRREDGQAAFRAELRTWAEPLAGSGAVS